jgi:hypothetical protein
VGRGSQSLCRELPKPDCVTSCHADLVAPGTSSSGVRSARCLDGTQSWFPWRQRASRAPSTWPATAYPRQLASGRWQRCARTARLSPASPSWLRDQRPGALAATSCGDAQPPRSPLAAPASGPIGQGELSRSCWLSPTRQTTCAVRAIQATEDKHLYSLFDPADRREVLSKSTGGLRWRSDTGLQLKWLAGLRGFGVLPEQEAWARKIRPCIRVTIPRFAVASDRQM